MSTETRILPAVTAAVFALGLGAVLVAQCASPRHDRHPSALART
ncbi:hypothetical protein ACNTMW_12910 [Planosporangium sp. 12N6]